jgi:ABC-2 type transport system permease protein
MKIYLALTIASLKMYFRNRQALFWALFFPLLIMVIFGIMNFDGYNAPSVGVHDAAQNDASLALIQALRGGDNEVLEVSTGTSEEIQYDLKFSGSRAAIVIPENYGVRGELAVIEVTYGQRFMPERAVVSTVIGQATGALFKEFAAVPSEFKVENSTSIDESFIEGQGQGFKAGV